MSRLKRLLGLKPIQNENGSALMSVMIIGTILLVLIGAFASYRFQRNKETQAQETRNVYNQLKENVKSGAAQTQSVGKSEELDFSKIQ